MLTDDFAPAPENLNEWKVEYPGVRGTIYHDTSSKGRNLYGKPAKHNAYRAEVQYNGQRFRKRSILYSDCLKYLLRLHEEYGQKPEPGPVSEPELQFEPAPKTASISETKSHTTPKREVTKPQPTTQIDFDF